MCTVVCFQLPIWLFAINSCLLGDLQCCLTLEDLLQFPAAEFNLMLGVTYLRLNNSRG